MATDSVNWVLYFDESIERRKALEIALKHNDGPRLGHEPLAFDQLYLIESLRPFALVLGDCGNDPKNVSILEEKAADIPVYILEDFFKQSWKGKCTRVPGALNPIEMAVTLKKLEMTI